MAANEEFLEQFGYTGLHAFVFIDEVDPGTNIRTVIDALRAFGPPPDGNVIFASELVGSSLGFAHIRVEEGDLAGLQDLIANDLWDRGAHCSHCVEAKVAKQGDRLLGAKRGSPDIIALVRIHTERGQLENVLDDLSAEEGPLADTFKGASVVFGDFDILLQLGASEFQVVADAVYGPLQQIAGIAHTDTSFTDGSRYE